MNEQCEQEIAVCEALKGLGCAATYEFPGYICIPAGETPGCPTWNLGIQDDDGAVWGGELMTLDGRILAVIEFTLPAVPEMPLEIACYILAACRGKDTQPQFTHTETTTTKGTV